MRTISPAQALLVLNRKDARLFDIAGRHDDVGHRVLESRIPQHFIQDAHQQCGAVFFPIVLHGSSRPSTGAGRRFRARFRNGVGPFPREGRGFRTVCSSIARGAPP